MPRKGCGMSKFEQLLTAPEWHHQQLCLLLSFLWNPSSVDQPVPHKQLAVSSPVKYLAVCRFLNSSGVTSMLLVTSLYLLIASLFSCLVCCCLSLETRNISSLNTLMKSQLSSASAMSSVVAELSGPSVVAVLSVSLVVGC